MEEVKLSVVEPTHRMLAHEEILEESNIECEVYYCVVDAASDINPYFSIRFDNMLYQRTCKQHPRGNCTKCATFDVSAPFGPTCKLFTTIAYQVANVQYPFYVQHEPLRLNCSEHSDVFCFNKHNFYPHVQGIVSTRLKVESRITHHHAKRAAEYDSERSIVEQLLDNDQFSDAEVNAGKDILRNMGRVIYALEHQRKRDLSTRTQDLCCEVWAQVNNRRRDYAADQHAEERSARTRHIASCLDRYALNSVAHHRVAMHLAKLLDESHDNTTCCAYMCHCDEI